MQWVPSDRIPSFNPDAQYCAGVADVQRYVIRALAHLRSSCAKLIRILRLLMILTCDSPRIDRQVMYLHAYVQAANWRVPRRF